MVSDPTGNRTRHFLSTKYKTYRLQQILHLLAFAVFLGRSEFWTECRSANRVAQHETINRRHQLVCCRQTESDPDQQQQSRDREREVATGNGKTQHCGLDHPYPTFPDSERRLLILLITFATCQLKIYVLKFHFVCSYSNLCGHCEVKEEITNRLTD